MLLKCTRCHARTSNAHGLPTIGATVGGCENCRYEDTAAALLDAQAKDYAGLEKEVGFLIPADLKAQGLSFAELLSEMGIDPDSVLSEG